MPRPKGLTSQIQSARFIGGSAFWQGVPNRNLTADEWAGLAPQTQAAVIAAGLYQLVDTSDQVPVDQEPAEQKEQ